MGRKHYLRDLLLHALAVSVDDFNIDIIIGVIDGLRVPTLVLTSENEADSEHQQGANDVANANDDPGYVVSVDVRCQFSTRAGETREIRGARTVAYTWPAT